MNSLVKLLSLSGLAFRFAGAETCPYLLDGTPYLNDSDDETIPDYDTYNTALDSLDIPAVFDDLYELLTDSQDCWPADTLGGETSYAGLFLRLAWHCAGTFRATDGEGGCAGGRQRYMPESAMDDNVNLDKARALLGPIKETYGDALSWGDLFVFAGTAGILMGGGPVTEVCAGRVDDVNGTKSNVLIDNSTCNIQGNCTAPLGSQQVGLIYVDAAGFLGVPNPNATAPHIREVFSRMDMNDSETVALIGGGHAFGKAHGACTLGAGPGPDEQPLNPWPGLCDGDLPDSAFTSGFEGQWTTYPFQWDNEYFTQLIEDEYVLETGPGGNPQWTNQRNTYMMLTTDIALISDDDFLEVVTEFANDQGALDAAFADAWEKLVTSGGMMANNSFCVPASDVAYDADMASTEEPDTCPYLLDGTPNLGDADDDTIPDADTYNTAVADLSIADVFVDLFELMTDSQDCWPADSFSSETDDSYAGLFLRLAWHCAGTFRATDGEGGCAGGRQRYMPESAMDDNVNLDKARALLGPIKETYGDALSWGDLFVFAGTAGILMGGGPVTEVCAGRVDEVNGANSDVLIDDSTCNIPGNCSAPLGSQQVGLIYVDAGGYLGVPDPNATAPHIREVFSRMDMNDSETVALIGGGHAFGKAHGACTLGAGPGPDEQPLNPWPGLCDGDLPDSAFTSGFEGQWTTYPFTWDNEYFTQLIEDEYVLETGSGGKYQWTNQRNNYMMLTTDIALISDDDFLEVVTQFANDQSALDAAFAAAWEKLVTSGGTMAANKHCLDASDLSMIYSSSMMPSDDDDDDATMRLISLMSVKLVAVSVLLVGLIF